MAEVKQVSGSFSLSSTSKKKPPSFSNNNGGGVSSSFKHIYDDVFASSSKTSSNSYMEDDDYAEVFGCSKSTNNGCWSIPYSSIPIIDLPKKEKDKEKDISSSKKGGERVDYCGVFGGIDGDDSFGLPNGEELFDHLNKKAKIFPRIQGQTTKADRPGISSRSCEQLPTNGFCQSFDNAKRFVPGNNEITMNATNGPRKAAHVRASSMHDVGATQKPLSSRTPLFKDSEKVPTNGFCQSSDNMHYEDGDNEMTENAASWPRKEDHIHAYSLHDVSASRKAMSNRTPVIRKDGSAPASRFCQSSDSMKHVKPVDSEMMVNAKNGSRDSAHVRAYSLREVSSTQKSLSSQTPVIKDDGKSSTNGVCQSSDSAKHFEHGDSEMIVNAKSGPRNAAHVRAYSLHDISDTQKSSSSKTPVIKDDALDADSIVGKKQGKHIRHTSLDVSANKQISDGDAGLQKVTSMRGSNSVEKSHGTCQPSEATTNGLCQSNENPKHSEYKTDDMKNSQFNGGTHAAEVHTNHEPNHALHELGPTQKTMSSRTSELNGTTQPGKDDVAEGLVKHSHDTSLDLGSNGQDGDCDTGLQKACGTYESTSVDTSHGACQASFEVSPSNVVNDDAEGAMGFGKVKKKGRRSRMTSLDLSDYNHSCEHDGGYQRKPRFGSSYSFDASHDPSAANVKVQPSKMYPSSSLPQFFSVESHYKVSSGKNSQKNMYGGGVDSPPSLAEELDVNSAAAVSAAALQRAIEEAEMRIRWAKAFLERECQGSTNLRFKDTLKVTVAKENGLANEMSNPNQAKTDDIFSSFESEIKPCSPLKRKHITTNAQEARAFKNQTISVNDGEFTEGTDAKVSELMREDQKCEGGEWEAAKHLNQIISGVKNKIVSFMSWQTETEKKEDLKETETDMKHQQHPEEVEHDLQDDEVLMEEETEKNQGTNTSSDEAMYGEDKAEFASEAVESVENESIMGINSKQEKVGNKVDFTPDTKERSLPILQFFAFRNRRLYDPPDSKLEENEPQEIRESEIENEQEQVVNEVKDEHLPCQGEEASPVELDKCVNQDSKSKDDMSDIGSNDGENDKAVEEPHSLAMHNAVDLYHEEDDMNRKGDICSVTEENAEMVEELYSSAGRHSRDLTHELDGQDDMCRKSHIGSINEENVEMVQEPYSLAGHVVKSFTDEESEQDDVCTESHIGSNNKENDEIVEEFYTPSGHESTVVHEEDNDNCLNKEGVEEPLDHSDYCKFTTESADKDDECEVLKEAEQQHNNVDILEGINVVTDPCKNLEAAEGVKGCQVNETVEINTNHIEEFSEHKYGCEETKPIQTGNVEETVEQVTVEASYVASAEEGCIQNRDVLLNKAEETSRFVESSSKVEEAVYPDEVIEKIIDMNNESEIDTDIPVAAQTAGELFGEEPEVTSLSAETIMEVDRDRMKDHNGFSEIHQCETNVSFGTDTDMPSEEVDVDVKLVEPQSQDLENQTDYMYESREKLLAEEYDTASDQDLDSEMSGVEAVHRRRRWFDNRGSIAAAERPSILEVNRADSEIDQEVLDESELTGSVEIHADKLECCATEVATAIDAEVSSNQDCSRTNVEMTPKRRRWFVNRGEAGVPEPLSLFEGVKVNLDLEVPLETKHETLLHEDNISSSCLDQLNTNSKEPLNGVKSDVRINGENGKQSGEAAPRRKRWFESRERVEPIQQVRIDGDGDVELAVELDQDSKAKGDDAENHLNPGSMPILQEKDDIHYKVESKEQHIDMDEVNRREKAKEKEKLAVERAIREARERAFAEARERARREAAEKPNVEGRQKVAAGVQEKLKVSSEGTSSSDKASVEAKLKAERAAVERATAEARERALQKSLSEKAFSRSREPAGKYSSEKNSSVEPKYQSSRSSNASNNSDKSEGVDVESAQRRKARLERQKRTTERAAKALEEKNKRDLVTQKEQAAKNMLADALDAEVRRWSAGKEGNLRALLSTLQYILGPDSGWQPVSLTDLVATTAVRKAYKKATLCVHPDKLQQRGASIQQKHICEKVFDLLKEAWSKFNPDER